jgi:hypothetical protein
MIVLGIGLAIPCRALTGSPTLPAYRITTPPTIDGTIGDNEWAGVPTGQGGFDTVDGHAAPEPMQFWLAHDNTYIYFAARLGDHDPKSIHAQQYQTNVDLSGDDHVELDLDLNGSMADFNAFGMNCRGATSLSLAGGRADKREWAGEFIARGRVTETGWEVEARIPWQMLRLPKAGLRDVRFNVVRFLPRDQRSYAFTYTQFGHQAETPVWQSVPIPLQQQARTLKLLPYGYTGYDARSGTVFVSGLDAKTELTDKITLVGTVNPDFRNIEDQILSLDFSRFERLANETRPFFQEGGQFMNSALYASQRIGSVDAGVNAYGRLNDRTSFGVIDTIRFGREHDFVYNASFDPTPNDSYRVTLTSFTQTGTQNDDYLARYSRQVGPVSLFFRSMGSEDTSAGRGHYDTVSAFYLKNAWNTALEYDHASPNFQARLGFLPEIDYKGPSYNVGYDSVFRKNPVSELAIGYSGLDYTHSDGSPYRRHNEVDSTLALRNRSQFQFNYYTEWFEGQDDHLAQTSLSYPRDDVFRHLSVEYDVGTLALVPYSSLATTTTYRVGQRLQTTARFQQVFHGGRQNQVILTSSYDLTHDRSVSGRLVKSDSDTNGYVSFRQSGNRGVEYYLIAGDPNALTFHTSIIAKVVIPIEIILQRASPNHAQ